MTVLELIKRLQQEPFLGAEVRLKTPIYQMAEDYYDGQDHTSTTDDAHQLEHVRSEPGKVFLCGNNP